MAVTQRAAVPLQSSRLLAVAAGLLAICAVRGGVHLVPSLRRRVPAVRPVLAWLWGCAVAHGVWIITVMLLTNVDFRWQIRTSLDRLEFQHSFIWPMATIVSAAALLRVSAEKLPGAASH